MSAVADPLIQATLLGEALDRGPVAVIVADEDRHFVAVNDFACRALGYTRGELLALTVADVVADAGCDRLFDGLRDARTDDGVARVRTKDGAVVDLHYRASRATLAGMTVYVGVAWTA